MSKIQGRFAQKESQFWNSALQIVGFESVREISFRPGHYATIPRRFCQGRVLINDGTRRADLLRDRRRHRHYSASPGASNGAWSASTATGPTIPACKAARP